MSKKILHINVNYISGVFHQKMVDVLECNGCNNHVLVPTYVGNKTRIEPRTYVQILECFNKIDRVAFHYKQRKIIRAIDNSVDINEYDCIHAYTTFTDGNTAMVLSKKYDKPYVVAVRDTDVNVFFKYMIHLRRTGLNVLLNAKAIFFLSSTYRDEVLKKYIPLKYREAILSKSHLITNGIDEYWLNNTFDKRDYCGIEERLSNKNLRLIFVGDISKRKNPIATCKAISILNDKGWNIEFIVAGKVVNKSIYNRIESQIKFHEFQNKEKLIELYREADVLVMPSITETFGLVYAEAMSQGLPVIYTRGQGFDEQFPEGEVGYSVKSSDYNEIADRLIDIAQDYEEISRRCIDKVKKFSWDGICDEYVKIYKNI